MNKLLKKLIREPLFHFLLLGAAIFAAYQFIPASAYDDPGEIIITKDAIASIREGYINMRQKSPAKEELDGLINQRIKEEVYYREALALGLDKDDIIIRRRLEQKMTFIAHDYALQSTPTEGEMSQYLLKNAEQFKNSPTFSFRQVYLDSVSRGNRLKSYTTQLVSDLNKNVQNPDFARFGDATILPSEMKEVSLTEVSLQFGKEFSEQLNQLTAGQWIGPVHSAFGDHVVILFNREEAPTPSLEKVRDAVLREMENEHLIASNEKFYRELLKNYKVIVEK